MHPIDTCVENYDPLKLVRDGTHQGLRLIPALDPANVPIDGKAVAHRLIFAKSYAEYLQYYNASNVVAGNWQPFFAKDPSVLLATCVVQDVDHYKSVLQTSFDYLNDITNAVDSVGVQQNLSWLFAYVGTLAQQIDALQQGLPTDVALRASLENTIQTRLASAFARLMSYYKADLVLPAADRLILSTLPVADADHDIVLLGAAPVPFATVYAAGLSTTWITDGSADWATFTAALDDDDGIYGDPTGTSFERANHIATHNLFTGVFDQFLMALARLVQDATAALQTTLTSYDKHEPHYALFLAFLQLLEHARESANTLTSRHLDFYYRDILQLAEREAQPGNAHLVFEPAKNVTQYELAEGTRFRAGKDADGNEIFFASDRTLVVNQGVVASMKKLYRHEGELFVAPIANSDDGVTTELKTEDKSWHPFFNKTFTDGVLSSVDMVPATVGFAIASHYLLLAEGQRTITVTLTVSGYSGAVGTNFASGVRCMLSGEKAWFDGTVTSFIATSATTLQLIVAIAGDAPAVVAADTKLHAITITPAAPVMQVTLTHVTGQDYSYEALEGIIVNTVTVHVDVDRVKNLVLSNDFGAVDPSKPFLPFGAQPESGSAMIVGSQEIFGKRDLITANLHVTWKNVASLSTTLYNLYEEYYPGTAYANAVPTVNVQSLVQGAWSTAAPQTLFDGDNAVTLSIKPPTGVFNPLDSSSFALDTSFTARTKTGFVKLSLPLGFGHKVYLDALTYYVVQLAAGNSPRKPTPPYTPEIESIHASYTASQTVQCDTTDATAFASRAARLFHVTDFGIAEQHGYLKIDAPDSSVYLFPQTDEGELYIGFTGLVPPESVAVLFQVVEGTANPLVLKPELHITWSYLRNNEWIEFAANDVEDGTSELLETGIVTFAMQRDATSNNSLFPSGMYWVRVSVGETSDAVCKLILVAAQAVEVTQTNSSSATTATVLPAGTIAKLERPDSAIKKVSQPSETFGGQGAEESTDFYTRISERLRHKDRAVTVWDFEHLVLEAFPDIHRVKCLNHTQYEPTESGLGIYKELAPGHITIITIPDLQDTNTTNALKPYTSLGVLEEVEAYLQERSTCFATLHVRNPQFEEVRVSFKVRLHDGFDETFYTNKLRDAITQFLSPWAYSSDEHPSFGGRVYQSVLVNLVEEQPYVDYVTDFFLFHDINGVQGTVNKQYVEGSRAVSVLVSVPASSHLITVIDPVEEESLHEQCECEE